MTDLPPDRRSPPTLAEIRARWNRDGITACNGALEIAANLLRDVPTLIDMLDGLIAENAALRDFIAGESRPDAYPSQPGNS
jgi:hypothetical protein